jgi:phosphatidylserine/phosphatidylglycerophosphate/cardiolipin synthase-like enzyme
MKKNIRTQNSFRRFGASLLNKLMSVLLGVSTLTASTLFLSQNAHAANPAAGMIDTCFSPMEACDLKLIAFINTSAKTLDVAIYSMTHAGIAAAIIAAQKRGVIVRMVVDRQQSLGSSSLTGQLTAAHVNLRIGNLQGIMHDKYTLVDLRSVEAGSFNYSNNATVNNAENQIYLNDPTTVAKYENNFQILWANSLAN